MYSKIALRASARVVALLLIHQFGFEGAEATFHDRIIETVTFAAHTALHAGCRSQSLIVPTRILAATVAVMHHLRAGGAPLKCHAQCV